MEYEVESERVIAFRPEIAKILNSNEAALMFQQLSHWSKYTKNKDGWIYKSTAEMFEETNVSERKQRKARDILVDAGWIEAEKKMANGSPTWHYRVLVNVVTKVLSSDSTSSTGNLPRATGKNAGSITREDTQYNLYVDFSEELTDDVHRIYKGWLIEMVIGAQKWLATDADSRLPLLDAAKLKTKLTPRRYKAIQARLNDLGLERCVKAVRNIGQSEHHRGINDRKWKASIEWLFERFEKAEEWSNK